MIPSLVTSFFIISIYFANPCLACGATNHNFIANHALSAFNHTDWKQLIQANLYSFQNGAAFPDWGYPLDGYQDASEFTHWPPFLRGATRYILNNFKPPYDDDAQALIALLFGITSHSAADISWHNLAHVSQTNQGWIETMAQLNFYGQYNPAHSESDEGGEFVLAYYSSLSFLEDAWYFPLDHVKKIYDSMNYSYVTEFKLLQGNALLYAEVQAFHYVAIDDITEGLFLFAPSSPFLMEQLYSFFIGGIDDMAQWSLRCWEDISRWFKNGVVDDSLCYIEPFQLNEVKGTDESWRRRKMWRESAFWKLYGESLVSNVEAIPVNGGRGYFFRNKEEISKVIQRKNQELASELSSSTLSTLPAPIRKFFTRNKNIGSTTCNDPNGYPTFKNSLTVKTTWPISYFGSSVHVSDINGNGIPDVVIGAPGFSSTIAQIGAAVILYDVQPPNFTTTVTLESSTSPPPNTVILTGNEEGAKFGSQVSFVNLNSDKFADIVTSSPYTGSASLNYRGAVHIYKGTQHLEQIDPDFTIFVPTGTIPPNYTNGPLPGAYTNLGTRLLSADLDGDGRNDLVIGSPFSCGSITNLCGNGNKDPQQAGMVAVFLSSKWQNKISTKFISVADADLIMYGQGQFNWFGYSLEFFQADPLTRVLLVGAPATPQNKTQNIGKLYAYNVSGISSGKSPQLLWSISGVQQFDQLGFHVSVSPLTPVKKRYSEELAPDFFIAISMPSRDVHSGILDLWQAGSVFVIPYGRVPAGAHSLDTLLSSGILFNGNTDYARLGWSTGWSFNTTTKSVDFWVTQPMLNGFRGAVYTWFGGSTFPALGSVISNPTAQSSNCFVTGSTSVLNPAFGYTTWFPKDNSNIGISGVIGSRGDATNPGDLAGSITILFS